MPARPVLRPGQWHRLGDAPGLLPLLQDDPATRETLAATGSLPHRLEATGPALRTAARHQLGSDPPRRLQEAVKKGGEETGPSPVDRAKSGTALHLACHGRAMPLGVIVTGANANDGVQTQKVLESLVIQPPAAERPVVIVEERSLPGAIGDGGYGNKPSRARAKAAGFRLRAPSRGRMQPGGGEIRNLGLGCYNLFGGFGRVARRLDRSAKRFLGWLQMAACVILVRSGFVR